MATILKTLKPIIALLIGIGIILIWIVATLPDDSIDNSLENIDETKFPISDYLYFNQQQKLLAQQQNNPNMPIDTNNPNNDENFDPNNASNPNQNGDNPPNTMINENGEVIEVDENGNPIIKDDKAKDENSIKNLFDTAIDKGKDVISGAKDSTQKYTNNIFSDEVIIDESLQKARLALLSTRNKEMKNISPSKNSSYGINREYGVDKFSNLDEQDKASNEHKLYRTISAMKMIPAVLITNISSDIGGKVIAQVEEDIFAEMGKAILIPKGSKVLGNYQNNNKIGEYRLNIAWTRILTPQGVNIMLTSAYGADIAGAMGAIGDLDSKYWQRYGIPLALSTISNGLIISLNNVTSKYSGGSANPMSSYMSTQLLQNLQTDISDIMAEIIKEQVRIQPTIRIEKGSRIFITSNKDIFFPIPKDNEVMARFFDEVKLDNNGGTIE